MNGRLWVHVNYTYVGRTVYNPLSSILIPASQGKCSELLLQCLSSVVLGQFCQQEALGGLWKTAEKEKSIFPRGNCSPELGHLTGGRCSGDYPENHPFPHSKPESPIIGSLLGITPLGATDEVRGQLAWDRCTSWFPENSISIFQQLHTWLISCIKPLPTWNT